MIDLQQGKGEVLLLQLAKPTQRRASTTRLYTMPGPLHSCMLSSLTPPETYYMDVWFSSFHFGLIKTIEKKNQITLIYKPERILYL